MLPMGDLMVGGGTPPTMSHPLGDGYKLVHSQ